MAKAIPTDELALKGLSRFLDEPSPKPLQGPAGLFPGGKGGEKPAKYCQENHWVERTGQVIKVGRASKELFRITAEGLKVLLDRSDPSALLGSVSESLLKLEEKTASIQASLQFIKANIGQVLVNIRPLDVEDLARKMVSASKPAEVSPKKTDWHSAVLDYVDAYKRRNPHGLCPLPELFTKVAQPHGLTIGQFHDGLRQLVQEKRLRLHPFTGAAYQLEQEHLAIVASQGIQYYVERTT
jgi:hypothetical protein